MEVHSLKESSESTSTLTESTSVSTDKTENSSFETQKTLAIIKPDVLEEDRNRIVEVIQQAGFTITKSERLQLNRNQAESLYCEHKGKDFYDTLINWITSAKIDALILEKENAVEEWKEWIGPTDPISARKMNPESIRAAFGRYGIENAVHGSSSSDQAMHEIDIVFGSSLDQSQRNTLDENYTEKNTDTQELHTSTDELSNITYDSNQVSPSTQQKQNETENNENKCEIVQDNSIHVTTVENAHVKPELMEDILPNNSDDSSIDTFVSNQYEIEESAHSPNSTNKETLSPESYEKASQIPETKEELNDQTFSTMISRSKKTKKSRKNSKELLIRLTTPTISSANKMVHPPHPASFSRRRHIFIPLPN